MPEPEPGFHAGPSAASLIEGLRDFGYCLETALADLVDNSISAGATRIEVLTRYDEDASAVGLLDDGRGMTDAELQAAMRLASTNPTLARAATDLGRFGLGMKTASFSQCRRMTVVTRRGSEISAATWDLDEVSRRDEWFVIRPVVADVPWSDRLVGDGTLVVWQTLDRVLGGEEDNRSFDQQIVDASEHLQLVFHRFLVREGKNKAIKLLVNNRALEPIDPFASDRTATQCGPEEIVRMIAGRVRLQSFTLPHRSDMGQAAWERLGGREGFIKNQGFYVYRARRLIVWGTWFGLAKQAERTKLARVRIDLPNSMDEHWKINVLKASAEPPEVVRKRLRRLIEAIVANSKRVYVHRGMKQAAGAELPPWQRVVASGGVTYQPNSDHPLIESLLKDLGPTQAGRLRLVLELLSKTLPVDAIMHDHTEAPERLNAGTMPAEELAQIVATTAQALRARKVGWDRVQTMMQSSPPFDTHWEATKRMIDEMKEQS
ncbi:MAG: ATP-binding protein [Sporichthyaceae bacterium]